MHSKPSTRKSSRSSKNREQERLDEQKPLKKKLGKAPEPIKKRSDYRG